MLLVSLDQWNIKKLKKKWWKLIKIANTDRENLQIFRTTVKFSGKLWLMIILKVTQNQGFNLSVENIFFEKKTQRRVKLTPAAFLGLNKSRKSSDLFFCEKSFV